MLKFEDLIVEPKNAEEVKTHLQQGKLCMQRLIDATTVFYKNKDLISIYVARTNGKVEIMAGVLDTFMEKLGEMEENDMELPTLLNVTEERLDIVLESVVDFESLFRSKIK